MPVFEFEHTDGKTYEIEAPDEKAALSAWGKNKPSTVGVGEDIAKASAVAPAKAGIGMLGSLGDVRGLLDSFAASNPAVSQGKLAEMRGDVINRNIPSSADVRKSVEGVTGPLYDPQTTPGKIAGAAVEGATGAALTGGRNLIEGGLRGVLPRLGVYGAAPGAAGEVARQQTEGYKFPEWVPGVGGKDISPYASTVASLFTAPFARSKVTPNKIDPTVSARAETYKNVTGDYPTVGQMTKDPRHINAELAAKPTINQIQKDAYNRGITEAVGEPTTNIDAGGPNTYIGRNSRRIGGDIDQLERTTTVNPNVVMGRGGQPQIYNDLANFSMHPDTRQYVPDILSTISQVRPHFTPTNYPNSTILPQEKIHDALFRTGSMNPTTGHINRYGGSRPMPGNEYNELRQALYREAEAGPPPRAQAFRTVANHLDNAMEASLPTDLQGAWGNSRRQYANFLAVEKAIGGKGAGKRQITPDEFKSASQELMGKHPYLRNELERNAFTEAAGEFPPLKKTSLPPEPSKAAKILSNIPGANAAMQYAGPLAGAATSALALHRGHDWIKALDAGILPFLIAAEGSKKVLMPPGHFNAMNPLKQAWGRNQFVPPDASATSRAAFIQALMAGQRANQNQQ